MSLMKCAVQLMLDGASERGEEALVFITGKDDNSHCIIGSVKARAFMMETDLAPLLNDFTKFCKERHVTTVAVSVGDTNLAPSGVDLDPSSITVMSEVSCSHDNQEVSGTQFTNAVTLDGNHFILPTNNTGDIIIYNDVNSPTDDSVRQFESVAMEITSDLDTSAAGNVKGEEVTMTSSGPEGSETRKRQMYVCDQCPQQFLCQYSIRRHQKRKHPEFYNERERNKIPQTECLACGQKFRLQLSMFKHRMRHHSEKKHSCPVCEKRFSYVIDLNRHVKTHRGYNPHAEFEETGLSLEELLKLPVKKGTQRFFCTACQLGFTSEYSMQKHNSDKHSDGNLTCHECGAMFAFKPELDNHAEFHRREWKNGKKQGLVLDPEGVCNICGLFLGKKALVANHKQKKHGKIKFSCGLCGKEMHSKYECRRHITSHGKMARDVVENYVINLPSGNNLTRVHVPSTSNIDCVTKSETVENSRSCFDWSRVQNSDSVTDIAKTRTIRNTSASVDVTITRKRTPKGFWPKTEQKSGVTSPFLVQGETPGFRCEDCQVTFYYAVSLEKHKSYMHTDKTFICEICNAPFMHEHQLEKHAREHTVERMNSQPRKTCNICGLTFRTSGGMQKHRVRMHTEKNLMCPHCGKMFALQHNLEKHITTEHSQYISSRVQDKEDYQ